MSFTIKKYTISKYCRRKKVEKAKTIINNIVNFLVYLYLILSNVECQWTRNECKILNNINNLKFTI